MQKLYPRQTCPLCHESRVIPFCRHQEREYISCEACRLVFVPPRHYLSAEQEKTRYDQHNNDPADPAYRAFLSRLFLPMQKRLPAASCGLDFGSGPGPTLSLMFEEAGHQMSIYDPFYAPDRSVFNHSYDFISAAEVLEHLHHPGFELDRLWSLLNPGGLLGVMTQLVPGETPFADWYYIKDPTHVCFFSHSTAEWLAERWQASLICLENRVMLFSRTADRSVG